MELSNSGEMTKIKAKMTPSEFKSVIFIFSLNQPDHLVESCTQK